MTELVPQTQASALDGVADLETKLKAIIARKPTSVPEKPPKAPKVVPVSEETREAISRLNGLLSSTTLPSERRRLTESELVSLEALGTNAKLVEKGVKRAVESVKTAAFNHFDVGLEESNDLKSLAEFRDPKTGHYYVAGEQEIPGTGRKFVRQLAQGSPTVTAAGLLSLVEDGTITRKQYLKLTRLPEVPRVLDEEALLDALNDEPELAEKIAPVIEDGKIIASFWIRDVAEEEED